MKIRKFVSYHYNCIGPLTNQIELQKIFCNHERANHGKRNEKVTNKEKLAILKEAKQQGVKLTLEKYGIYPGTFYYWKNKFEQLGEVGLQHGMNKNQLAEIRKLEKENRVLKDLLAEKELESRLKGELLKKKYPISKTFYSNQLHWDGDETNESFKLVWVNQAQATTTKWAVMLFLIFLYRVKYQQMTNL